MHWLETRVPPLAAVAIAAGLMWMTAKAAPGWALDLPFHTIAAVTLSGIGIALAIAGVAAFRSAETTVDPRDPRKSKALVNNGIFRLTRNPMYVGMALALLGLAAYLAHPLSALIVVLFVFYIDRFQIVPEERALAQQFGAAFDAYKAQVRRWL